MKKRIISFLLCGTMCFSFIGCGNGNAKPSTSSTTMTSSNEVEESATTESVETVETIEAATTEESTSLETEENTESSETVAEAAKETFLNIMETADDLSVEEIANMMLEESNYPFAGATMVVEPGFLSGFQAEIDGFDEGCMFSPIISTIPFVGYIFEVKENQDEFISMLEENADLRWNICTEADEMVIELNDQYVLFLMCPSELEE